MMICCSGDGGVGNIWCRSAEPRSINTHNEGTEFWHYKSKIGNRCLPLTSQSMMTCAALKQFLFEKTSSSWIP